MSATTVKSAQVVRWRIPIVLAVTVFVNYLDRNNLALALPRIARDFGWSDRRLFPECLQRTRIRARSTLVTLTPSWCRNRAVQRAFRAVWWCWRLAHSWFDCGGDW